MQFFRKIVLFITFFFVTGFSIAQNKNEVAKDSYYAILWTKDDGLPDVYTHTMFKDVSGFLWVGGESFNSELCRFDGAVFKKYLPGQKRGAISSDDVYTFKEDSLHNIWMATDKP